MTVRHALPALLAALALSGCMANPGPPPVVEEKDPARAESTTTTTLAPAEPNANPDGTPKRTTISVGVEPLRAGLNPHIVANNSELVEQIADLVLPSAFRNGAIDPDVLTSAEQAPAPDGVAQRIEYVINPAAQWSDGTPLTGADFEYLWRSMISTSGVDSPAGYRAISAVNFTDGGRRVTVDFSTPVKDWRLLFADLVPSHLLQGADRSFVSGLASNIPASAGRYMVNSVDLARGIITLNRNDRFWGRQPAKVDVLQLRSVRSTSQAVSMLRSGQIGFADFIPEQTTMESLGLLPGVQAITVDRPRQLRMHLSTASNALDSEDLRRQFASLIDPAQIARLATGRTDDLRPGANPVTVQEGARADLRDLRARARLTPVRIAADPTDAIGLTAASTMVDVLAQQNIPAEVVQERMTTITSDLLPNGNVDAVLTWEDTSVTSLSMANAFQCTSRKTGAGAVPSETSASATPTPANIPLAGDLSGFCPDNAGATRADILSGAISPSAALSMVRAVNKDKVLYVPIMDETRVHAIGKGIVGPGTSVKDWDQGIDTAPSWEVQ